MALLNQLANKSKQMKNYEFLKTFRFYNLRVLSIYFVNYNNYRD
jgi:hypothetical protein